MKAIKKINKNGTFRFELSNGDVIIESTKRDYNAFIVKYKNNKYMQPNYIKKNSSRIGFTLSKLKATTTGSFIDYNVNFNPNKENEKSFFVTI